MRFDERIMKTVVYVGHVVGSRPFIAFGTGFVGFYLEGDHRFQVLVTAKHVIEDIPGEDVHIRVNRLDGVAEVIATNKTDWLSHPDQRIDLMVCPTRLPTDQFDILHLDICGEKSLTKEVIARDEIGIGDQAYVAGLFVKRKGIVRNTPIMRAGIISAMPDEDIETTYGSHPAYLIEMRSIDGLSGSPVFVTTSFMRLKDGEFALRDTMDLFLAGVLLGHDEAYNPHDKVEIISGGSGDKGERTTVPLPLNTGIGIVLPIWFVKEALEQDVMKKGRHGAIESHKMSGGFVPDSVAVSEPPTTDEIPQHREDFNRLLDAAVSGKKPGSET